MPFFAIITYCASVKAMPASKVIASKIFSTSPKESWICAIPRSHEDKLHFKILLMKQHSSDLLHLSFQSEFQCTDKKINASELSNTFCSVMVVPQ